MNRKGRSRMSKSSRVSEKVLEYYMQFGKERELEKFMRFRSPKSGTSTTTTSSSGDEWAQVGNLQNLFCEQRRSTSPIGCQRHVTIKTNEPIKHNPQKEHIVPIRIEGSGDEKKSLSSSLSPKTPAKDKPHSEQKSNETPESVKKSHKRLEWDSLGDVGYRKSKSTSNISIVERMLLREFFEVTVTGPKQMNSSENDIRLLEQEIAELGTLKKHFSKPLSPAPPSPPPPPPPTSALPPAIQKDVATEYSSPLASSTRVELVVPKLKLMTIGTNTTPLEPKYEKYAQTSIQRPEMTSQEVQVAFTPTVSSLCSSVEPSSFEYQHQPSTLSEASKSTAPSHVCDDQSSATGTHPFVQNVKDIIARRKALAERCDNNLVTISGDKDADTLKQLYDTWQNVMDENKENTSSSDCSTATSSTPQIDLGIQLICGIMKAKSIDQKQKKRLLRNIVKRLAKVASSCELDAIVSRTASLINIKLGEAESVKPQMESKQRVRSKSSAPPTIPLKNAIAVNLVGGQNKSKTTTKKKDMSSEQTNISSSSEVKSNEPATKKIQSPTKKQRQTQKSDAQSILVKSQTDTKEKKSTHKAKDIPIERKSTKKDVKQQSNSPPKTSSLQKTSTTRNKSRTTAGQNRDSIKKVNAESKIDAVDSCNSTTTTTTTTCTSTSTSTSSGECATEKKRAVFEFTVCIPPKVPDRIDIITPTNEELCTESMTTSSKDLATEKEAIPMKVVECEEWLRPMTQSEIEYECKKRMSAAATTTTTSKKDEKRRSNSTSTSRSERKVQINWIESEIDRLQNLRCLLLEGNTSATSSTENQTEEIPAQSRKSEKLYDIVISNDVGESESAKKDDEEEKPKETDKCKVTKRRCSTQRSKIDTPVGSCSVKSFVRQRKHEFFEHYKSQKLHHYNNMHHKSNEGPLTDCTGFTYAPQPCTQYGQYPQCYLPNAYNQCGNYYTYPPMSQMQNNACCYYPPTQCGGQAPATARVSFPNKTTRFCSVSTPTQAPHTSSSAFAVSSELSVPMGSYGASSTPTTTHQYDDVCNAALTSATTMAPSMVLNSNACVQTGASLERRSQPVIYPARCKSPSYNMVPYATYASCGEVAKIAQTAEVQVTSRGIAYALEFVPKARTKPDGHSEVSTCVDEFKMLDKRGGTSLQAALQHGRPEFMEEAKKRKAILNRIQQMRQERERDMRDIADDNSSINTLDRRLQALPPPPTEQVRIFQTKEMKALTNKRAAILPEVIAGKEREREERRRRSNRMLREVFNRRLQQRVRKGKLSLNHSHTVI